jgi:hypothetical protein
VARTVTEGTEFAYPDYPGCLAYDPDLNFLTVQGNDVGTHVSVCGYSPLPPGVALPSLTFATVDLQFAPPQDRTIDKQGKGVGLRLYNSPHAVAGLAGLPLELGVYTAEIALDRLLDMRAATDHAPLGALQRIGRHAGRIIKAHTQGLYAVVNDVHTMYGAAEVVLFNQPPRAKLRERMRHVQPPIPSAFLLVRSQQIALYGVGRRYAR